MKNIHISIILCINIGVIIKKRTAYILIVVVLFLMSFMFYKNFYITVTLNKSLSFEVNEEDINRDIKEGIY